MFEEFTRSQETDAAAFTFLRFVVIHAEHFNGQKSYDGSISS